MTVVSLQRRRVAGCRLPTKLPLPQLPARVRRTGREQGRRCDLGPGSPGWRVENAAIIKRENPGADYGANSWFSRLKWLNSPYRPALPEGIRAAIVPPLSRQVIGASPSGKAVDFDSTMRRFESSRPSQAIIQLKIVRHYIMMSALCGKADMACSARRPKKVELRDGCASRMRSLQLQKSPTADFEKNCGNSPDISKGFPQLGMFKFESSQVSQAIPKAAIQPLKRMKSLLLARFRNIAPVSELSNWRTRGPFQFADWRPPLGAIVLRATEFA
jgi:hypothetical protein